MKKRLPDKMTNGEKYGPAMEITDELEAKEYFESCVEHQMRFGYSREEAEQIERLNLGYYAGYCDGSTMARVQRLFGGSHAIYSKAIEYRLSEVQEFNRRNP